MTLNRHKIDNYVIIASLKSAGILVSGLLGLASRTLAC